MQFKDLVPASGWIRKYVCYGMGSSGTGIPETYLNEIPIEFHLFTGLTCLGAALRRRIYLSQGVYNIYPAMLTVLVAPTGRCRKTTAINIGSSVLRTSGTTKIISEWITPEALCLALKQERLILKKLAKEKKTELDSEAIDACGIVVAPELSVFLNQAEYLQGLVPLLTRLADCPDIFSTETISRSVSQLENVALSAIMGTAPAWMMGTTRTVAFTGGFMARQLFICRYVATQPAPRPPLLSRVLKDELVKELIFLSKRKGSVPFAKEAETWWDAWYNKFYYEKSPEEKRAAYHERKQDHLARIALILSISKNRMEITVEDLEEAKALLEATETGMFELFGTLERTSSVEGYTMDIILKTVRKAGRLDRTSLIRRLSARGYPAASADIALTSCIEGGFIKQETEAPSEKSRSKKPKTFYKYLGGEDADE